MTSKIIPRLVLSVAGLAAVATALLPVSEAIAAPDKEVVRNEKGYVGVRSPDPQSVGQSGKPRYRDGELLVKFKPSVPEGVKQSKHQRLQSEVVREHKELRLHQVRLKNITVAEALARYQEDPDVEYAEPNFMVSASAGQITPNDPGYSQLWGMAKVSAPAAWKVTTGNGSAVVAVIDTGIDYTHPDLMGNLWVNQGELNGQPSTDNDGNGYRNDVYGYNAILNSGDPKDDHYHGTHVAGTIGAVGNNGVGVAGMAWNTKIMACKFLGSDGSGDIGDAIECLQYVKAMKARGVNIVATNNSWGSFAYSQALYDAIRDTKDILFVAAAGNNNTSIPFYPAGYDLPNIISVAASDSNDQKASFSNYNSYTVDIAAPGSGIYSTYPNNSYDTLSGTSMAAPHVSGLAALLSMQTPGRSAPVLKNLILAGGDPVSAFAGNTVTGRRINAYKSVTCSSSPVFGILQVPPAPQPGVPQTISAMSINCGSAVGPVTVTLSGGGTIQLADDGVAPDEVAGDGIFMGTWTPAGSAAERLTFSSSAGTASVTSPRVAINANPTVLAPAMLLPSATSAAINTPFSQTFTTSGGRPPFSWSLASGYLPSGVTLNAATGEISGTSSSAGLYSLTVQVRDSLSEVATKSWNVVFHKDLRPGWPKELQERTGRGLMPVGSSPVLADLDGDGKDEIIVSDLTDAYMNGEIWETPLYVLYPDGSTKSVMLPGILGTPAAADLDGDGRKEIIVSTHAGAGAGRPSIYAFHDDLTPVSGFPTGYYAYYGAPGSVSSPVVADFFNDGRQEIAVLASPNNRYDVNYGKNLLIMVDSSGAMMPGYPKVLGGYLYADGFAPFDLPPAVGDLDQDGARELVMASADGYLRIVAPDGTLRKEWQFDPSVEALSPPVLADLDGDGYPDIVVKYHTSGVTTMKAFDRNGTPLTGWPKTFSGDFAPAGPVVGDLDGDGRNEIVVVEGSLWNEIHVLHGDGSYLSGWPLSFFGAGAGINCYPVLADIDGDGKQEIIVTADSTVYNGMVEAYTANGTSVPGFPKYSSPDSEMRSTAAIGDVDGNGKVDLLVRSENGYLYLWELPGDSAAKDLQWPMFRMDAGHSAAFRRTLLETGPAITDFREVVTGTTSAAKTIAITNRSRSSAAISSITLSGSDSGMFTLSPGSCGALPRTLLAQQSCDVTVAFSPSSTGPKAAMLMVQPGTAAAATPAYLRGDGILPFHTLSYSKAGDGNGTISGGSWTMSGSGSRNVTVDTIVTLTPAPSADSVFSGWTGCDSVSGDVCTVTMSSDKSIGASFTIRKYTVSATSSGAGTISPPSSTVSYGGSLTVTVTPAAGKAVLAFLDNGSAATLTRGSNNTFSYTLSNVTEDHALTGTFTSAARVTAVAAGSSHSIALLDDGTVWASGYNGHGQLGDGTTTASYLPVQVQGLSGVTTIAAGIDFGAALKADGTVWCWGYNNYGQVGDGTTTDRLRPVQVAGVSGVTALSAGGSHLLALKGDGTVWGWGSNSYGQLGDGSKTNRPAPVQVPGLSGVTAIASHSSHSVVRRSDGTVWGWGTNSTGELGDGTYSERLAPTQAAGISEVVAIAAGYQLTAAVKADGTVYVWGTNAGAFYNDGSVRYRTLPTQVAGLSGVTAVSAGFRRIAVLKGDGTVWSWGSNSSGAVGDGSGLSQTQPVQVAELTGVTAISAGWYHTMALAGDNTVWGWGSNFIGYLGDGTNVDRTTRSLTGFGNSFAPAATISGTPAASNLTSATLSIGGADVVAYRYKLDGGAYSAELPVSALIQLTALPEGTHVVSVIGKDSAGNWQPIPTTAGWAVDVTPPAATVTGVAANSSSTSATLTVGGSDVAAYKYSVDGGGYSAETPYYTTIALTSLTEGPHAVSVLGKDTVGNWQTVPTVVSWLVDTAPPVTTASPGTGSVPAGQTVTLTCSDGSGSGCATTRYCFGAGCLPSTIYSGPITVNTSIDLRFSSTDAVGKTEATKTASYTVLSGTLPVSLTVAGTGGGTVVSTPAGISSGSSVSSNFPSGSTVTLRATPGAFSLFTGWSGACGGTADCVLTMTAGRSVTATFDKDYAHSIFIPSGAGLYSASIQGAYDASADSDPIRIWGTDFIENVLFATEKKVYLMGGYNQLFSSQDTKTILHGSLRVARGNVIVDRLAVR